MKRRFLAIYAMSSLLMPPAWVPAQAQRVHPSDGTVCPATDGSIRVKPIDAPQALKSGELPAAFGWTLASAAAGVFRLATWFEVSGPGARKVDGYLPNRLWLSNRCAYQLRVQNSYRPSEGEHWFAYDQFPPPRSVTILNSGETTDHKIVSISLTSDGRGSRLMVCRASSNERPSCKLLVASRREIRAIRYLQSPDSLMGTIGIIESAPAGRLWAIGAGVNAASFRSPQ